MKTITTTEKSWRDFPRDALYKFQEGLAFDVFLVKFSTLLVTPLRISHSGLVQMPHDDGVVMDDDHAGCHGAEYMFP